MSADFEVYYVHSITKTVINLAELRCISEDDRVIVEKTLYDDNLNVDYNYIKDYSKTEIMSCYDWDIVPISDNSTTKEIENYKLNKRYVDACKKYDYKGYEIYFNQNEICLERSKYWKERINIAAYTIELNNNIKNNSNSLINKIFKQEDFISLIYYYKPDFETLACMKIYTDVNSYKEDLNYSLEMDLFFGYKVIRDREFERERSIF